MAPKKVSWPPTRVLPARRTLPLPTLTPPRLAVQEKAPKVSPKKAAKGEKKEKKVSTGVLGSGHDADHRSRPPADPPLPLVCPQEKDPNAPKR